MSYGLAFSMLSVSIHALQVTNILPSYVVNGVPTIDWTGNYPSWEVLLPQGICVALSALITVRQHGKE